MIKTSQSLNLLPSSYCSPPSYALPTAASSSSDVKSSSFYSNTSTLSSASLLPPLRQKIIAVRVLNKFNSSFRGRGVSRYTRSPTPESVVSYAGTNSRPCSSSIASLQMGDEMLPVSPVTPGDICGENADVVALVKTVHKHLAAVMVLMKNPLRKDIVTLRQVYSLACLGHKEARALMYVLAGGPTGSWNSGMAVAPKSEEGNEWLVLVRSAAFVLSFAVEEMKAFVLNEENKNNNMHMISNNLEQVTGMLKKMTQTVSDLRILVVRLQLNQSGLEDRRADPWCTEFMDHVCKLRREINLEKYRQSLLLNSCSTPSTAASTSPNASGFLSSIASPKSRRPLPLQSPCASRGDPSLVSPSWESSLRSPSSPMARAAMAVKKAVMSPLHRLASSGRRAMELLSPSHKYNNKDSEEDKFPLITSSSSTMSLVSTTYVNTTNSTMLSRPRFMQPLKRS